MYLKIEKFAFLKAYLLLFFLIFSMQVFVGVSVYTAFMLAAYLCVLALAFGRFAFNVIFQNISNITLIPYVIIGLATGILLYPILLLPFWIMGVLNLNSLILLVLIVMSIYLYRPFILNRSLSNKVETKNFLVVCILAFFITALCFLAITNIGPVRDHFLQQAISSISLSIGWPPENAYVAGVPYRDNFGIHLFVAAISKTLNIDIAELGGYSLQPILLLVAILTFASIAKIWLKLSTISIVAAIIACYFVLGRSPIVTDIYGSSQTQSSLMTLSPLLGYIGFLLTSILFINYSANQENKSINYHGLFLVLIFLFSSATMLARANAGALLGVSVSLFWLYRVWIYKNLQFSLAIAVFAVALGCFFSMAISLGTPFGDTFSATGFLKFSLTGTYEYLSGSYIGLTLQKNAVPTIWSGFVAFIVAVLLHSSFLAPFFWVKVFNTLRGISNENEVYLSISALAGVLLTAVTIAPGGSNFVFLQISKLSMCLLGAIGLESFLHKDFRYLKLKGRLFILKVSVFLFMLHAVDIAYQVFTTRPYERFFKQTNVNTAHRQLPADIKDLLQNIDNIEKSRFIFGADLSTARIKQLMAIYHIRLLVDPLKIPIYISYNSDYSDNLKFVEQSYITFGNDVNAGYLNLPCATPIVQKSLIDTNDIFLISDSKLKIIESDNFSLIKRNHDFLLWRANLDTFSDVSECTSVSKVY